MLVDFGQPVLRPPVQQLPQGLPPAASPDRGSQAREGRGLRSRRRVLVALKRKMIFELDLDFDKLFELSKIFRSPQKFFCQILISEAAELRCFQIMLILYILTGTDCGCHRSHKETQSYRIL